MALAMVLDDLQCRETVAVGSGPCCSSFFSLVLRLGHLREDCFEKLAERSIPHEVHGKQ